MENILKEKLGSYIVANNPDLLTQLQAGYSVTKYLEDKMATVRPLMENLLAADEPLYLIEERCLEEMTAELRPSKFNYIKLVLEEEFRAEFNSMVAAGVLNYEVINLIGACKGVFETFEFSEANEDDRFLRYAIIAEIHNYLN
jgi:hypothetical protein